MRGGIVDTMLGSFNNHDARGRVNLAIKMNSDFLSHRKRCDVYVSVVVFTSSIKRRIMQFFTSRLYWYRK